jgi:hypothetical protein
MQKYISKIWLVVLLSFISILGFSQKLVLKNNGTTKANLSKYTSHAETFLANKKELKNILNKKPATLQFQFSLKGKTRLISLEKNNIYSSYFYVVDALGYKQPTSITNNIVCYKAVKDANNKSLAAVSITADGITAIVAEKDGNINIAALSKTLGAANDEHIIFNDADLLIPNTNNCLAESLPTPNQIQQNVQNNSSSFTENVNTEPIDIYYEADFSIFNNNGGNITNVANYVTNLHNVVSVLYNNEQITIALGAIKVWNIADPYVSLSGTLNVLYAFSANMQTGFPGDFAHLLSQRNLGGGIAFLNTPCAIDYYRTAVSANLTNSVVAFPTYSWNVMVITHELGHNFGSNHTQWCGWTGGALDNCYTTEGGCAPGPAPVGGGTIMSYCHLTSNGINLANGFGIQPGNFIRGVMTNNTCINPQVFFETTATTVDENEANVENGCLDYKEVLVKVKLNYPASAPVDATLTNFPNPGMVVGANGDVEMTPAAANLNSTNLAQSISYRVFNDARIEATESLFTDLTINANGGNAILRSSNDYHVLTVTSSDHKPDSTVGRVVYSENFDGVTTGLGSFTEELVHGASSTNRWTISTNGGPGFSGKVLHISNNNSALAYNGTNATDTTTTRAITPVINGNGFTNLILNFRYKCNGEFASTGGSQGGSLVFRDYGKVLYSLNAGTSWTVLTNGIAGQAGMVTYTQALPAAANNATNLRFAFEWNNGNSVVNNPPFAIDSIVVTGTSTSDIQSATHPNNAIEERLGPNQTVHFFNPITKRIMATLENNTTHDFGCVEMNLLRTGSNATAAWNPLAANFVTDKMYRVTVGNPSTTVPYTLKFYYTDDELNGWQTTTGNNLSSIEIVKSNTNLTAPSSEPIYSSVNTNVTYGATAHKVVGASFTGIQNTTYYALAKQVATNVCNPNLVNFAANTTGTTYQWQVSVAGGAFTNLSNGGAYSNATTATLAINNPAVNLIGNKYRCSINGSFGNVFSQEYLLKFESTWLGGVNSAWENPANWSCNALPSDKTDVIIAPALNNPQLSSSTSIRSLTSVSGSNLIIQPAVNLTIIK